jgi:hypothetical protein
MASSGTTAAVAAPWTPAYPSPFAPRPSMMPPLVPPLCLDLAQPFMGPSSFPFSSSSSSFPFFAGGFQSMSPHRATAAAPRWSAIALPPSAPLPTEQHLVRSALASAWPPTPYGPRPPPLPPPLPPPPPSPAASALATAPIDRGIAEAALVEVMSYSDPIATAEEVQLSRLTCGYETALEPSHRHGHPLTVAVSANGVGSVVDVEATIEEDKTTYSGDAFVRLPAQSYDKRSKEAAILATACVKMRLDALTTAFAAPTPALDRRVGSISLQVGHAGTRPTGRSMSGAEALEVVHQLVGVQMEGVAASCCIGLFGEVRTVWF